MSEHKDEIYLFVILLLVIYGALAPSLRDYIHSVEECKNEGSIIICREVYTKVVKDWYLKEAEK